MTTPTNIHGKWQRSIVYVLFGLLFFALALEAVFTQGVYYYNITEFFDQESTKTLASITQREKANLKNLVEAPYNILKKYEAESKSTDQIEEIIFVLSRQIDQILNDASDGRSLMQKRELIKQIVGSIRFGADGKNYIWINDTEKMVLHPSKQVIGMSVLDPVFNDRMDGTPILDRMIATCQKVDPKNGKTINEARLLYSWPKPGEDKPQYKMSYMRFFPVLGWFLGGGIYVDEIIDNKKTEALAEIRNLRLADGNYFWVHDTNNLMLMHPMSPELNGRDMSGHRDSKGIPFIKEMTDRCLDQGEAFIEYSWPKPGDTTRDYPKLAYVKLFKPWNMIVGMGVYTDAIEQDSRELATRFGDAVTNITIKAIIYGLAVMAAIFLVTGFGFNAAFIKPLKALETFAARVVAGNLDVAVGHSFFMGELLTLKASMERMLTHLKEQISTSETKSREALQEADRAREAMTEAELASVRAQKVEQYQKTQIHSLGQVFKNMAEGDLLVRYHAGDADEDTTEARASFLELELSLAATTENLAALLRQVQTSAGTVSTMASDFLSVASDLRSGSDTMAQQAGAVAGATEEMSMNINSMASAAEEMSVNVSTISATAEQMSATMGGVSSNVQNLTEAINAIAANAHDGASVATRAMDMAGGATATMRTLGDAAKEIGKVTDVIKRIAEQTNLLALNATIEAASAGDAGRGFAVVAGEIKELANQSAKAAEDIANKIQGIQATTDDAVTVIAEVTGIIGNINEAVGTITSAVENQTRSATDIAQSVEETNKGAGSIARSIAELSKGAGDMSQNAGEVAKGVNEVAQSVVGVSTQARAANTGAEQVNTSAANLAKVAGQLGKAVSKFKV
ncbi:MAG: methyl-accepting chemotaxis protein [Desulfovibrionaceae bacterium]